MYGYQAPAISLFLLGGWILSGLWPTDYDGKYRAVVGFVNDQIASFGHVPLGGAIVGVGLLVTLIGWASNRARRDDGGYYEEEY
jgi:hypothetical protein